MLMLVQIDDRSGEVLGRSLQKLAEMGARNVQLLSSHTKKGRPGAVLLIDVDEALESEVAVYLAAELGAWGYHVLAADHRHFDVRLEDRRVTVACGTRQRTFTMPCKFFSHEGTLLRVKVERDDVEAVQAFVRETDDACSSETVRTLIEHGLRQRPGQDELELRVS